MRMLMIGASAALAVAVAACDGGEAPEPAVDEGAVNEAAPAEAAGNQVEALPEGQRNAVFIRAIQDSGQDCQHVDSSARAGEHQGLPVWTATCQSGVQYTIVIGNDGTASVLNPAEAALLGNEAAQNAAGE